MLDLGGSLARAINNQNCIIYLQGNLGVGKTTLVRGFLKELGHAGKVKSPTFTIVEPYQLNSLMVYHLDLYRLQSADELENIGIRDYFENSVILIEWPENARKLLPKADLICKITFDPHHKNHRDVTLISESVFGEKIIAELTNNYR